MKTLRSHINKPIKQAQEQGIKKMKVTDSDIIATAKTKTQEKEKLTHLIQ